MCRTSIYIIVHVNFCSPSPRGATKKFGIKCAFLLTQTVLAIQLHVGTHNQHLHTMDGLEGHSHRLKVKAKVVTGVSSPYWLTVWDVSVFNIHVLQLLVQVVWLTSNELVILSGKNKGTNMRLDRKRARQYPMVLMNSWVPLVYISAGVPSTKMAEMNETRMEHATGNVPSLKWKQ